MKTLGRIVRTIALLVLAALAGAIAGAFVPQRLWTMSDFRAETQVTFSGKDEVTVEFPALVRGRRINCTVIVDTKRKVQSVFC